MQSDKPLVNTIGINHITLATRNLEQAIDFYTNVLGLTLVASWNEGAYLLAGDVWFCLNLDPKIKKCTASEYSHIAFTVNLSDFENIRKGIIEEDIAIWKENSSEGESLYILDPDCNKLELHATMLQDRLNYIKENPYPGMKFYHKAMKA